MTKWVLRTHQDFLKDVKKLGRKEASITYKKIDKIKSYPLRQKHLSGRGNVYREPITNNIRLIYLVRGNEIFLMAVDNHERAYEKYKKRLFNLKWIFGMLL